MIFFFFNDTATTEIYTLSLHDALPDLGGGQPVAGRRRRVLRRRRRVPHGVPLPRHAAHVHVAATGDRKSTRLNSSHANISYAVFCLKKKKTDTLVHQCV